MPKQGKIALVAILIILSIGTSIGFAKDEDVNPWIIDSYEAIIEIGSDGSMKIEEYIGYNFERDFSGILTRDMDTSSASDIDDLEIFTIEEINHEDISQSKLTPLDPSSYQTMLDEDYGIMEGLSLSLEPEIREKYLVYKYKLNDLVGIYNDTALLDWTFLNHYEQFSKNEMVINITLDATDNRDGIQAILEGPIYTETNADEEVLEYKGHFMDDGKDLRIIMLLPTSVVPEGRKMIDNNIVPEVQDWMSQYEREIEILQSEYGTGRWIRGVMAYLGFGIIILTFAYIYIKFGQNSGIQVKDEAYKHLPINYYTPAELGFLMNRGKVRPNYLVATLIDLCNRGYLHVEDAEDNGFALSINEDANTRELKSYEEYLLGWIFGDIGQGISEVTTKDIYAWVHDHANRKRYRHKYETWVTLVTKQTARWKFFESVDKARLLGLLSGVVALVCGVILTLYDDIILGIIVMSLSIALMVYSRLIVKPTEFGAINIAKWNNLKELIKEDPKTHSQGIENNDYEKLLGYFIPLDRWDDILVYLESYYNDGGLMSDRDVITRKNNLGKTRELISAAEKCGHTFKGFKGLTGRGFSGGKNINT